MAETDDALNRIMHGQLYAEVRCNKYGSFDAETCYAHIPANGSTIEAAINDLGRKMRPDANNVFAQPKNTWLDDVLRELYEHKPESRLWLASRHPFWLISLHAGFASYSRLLSGGSRTYRTTSQIPLLVAHAKGLDFEAAYTKFLAEKEATARTYLERLKS